MSELGESIGYTLLPYMEKLVDALTKAVDWVDRNRTTAALLVGGIVALVAAVAAINGVMAVYNALMAVATIRTAMATEGTVAYAIASKVTAAASKAWAVAQWALNAALTAKSDRHHHRPDRGPGGRLHRRLQEVGYLQEDRRRRPARYRGGGQVDVEQRHQTRVRGVHGWHQGGWQGRPVALEQRLQAGVFKLIIGGVAMLLEMWAKMLRALSHVPGFGWAKVRPMRWTRRQARPATCSAPSRDQAVQEGHHRDPHHPHRQRRRGRST